MRASPNPPITAHPPHYSPQPQSPQHPPHLDVACRCHPRPNTRRKTVLPSAPAHHASRLFSLGALPKCARAPIPPLPPIPPITVPNPNHPNTPPTSTWRAAAIHDRTRDERRCSPPPQRTTHPVCWCAQFGAVASQYPPPPDLPCSPITGRLSPQPQSPQPQPPQDPPSLTWRVAAIHDRTRDERPRPLPPQRTTRPVSCALSARTRTRAALKLRAPRARCCLGARASTT